VAAFAETPPEIAREISKALLNLGPENPGHRGVLEAIGIAGFQESSDLDYDILRKAMDGLSLPY
jgi:ABC-type phosphate/phosphonate transport system substrate-binding protein